MNTILQICDNFSSYLSRKKLGQSTQQSYCAVLKQFLLFLEDNFGWEANQLLEKHHFRGYYLSLFLQRKEKNTTLEKKISILRTWANSCNFKLPTYYEFRGTIPTFDELRRLFNSAQGKQLTSIRDKLLLLLLLGYGLSSTELNRIKLHNIDLEKKQMFLNQNYNLEARTLPVIPQLYDLLQHYIQVANPSDNLLLNTNNQPLTEAGIRFILQKLLAKAGLPNYSPRDIRRGWLKYLSYREPIAIVLALSGLGPQMLKPMNYQQILEEWLHALSEKAAELSSF